MAIALSLAASAGYGLSDFLAGRAARQVPVVLLALWSQVASGSVLLLVVLGLGQLPSVAALGWGAAVGAVAALGTLAFYRALATGPTSVVAPVAASGVLVPVLVDLLRGDSLSGLVLIGLPLTFTGLAVVSLTSESEDPEAAPTGVGHKPRLAGGLVRSREGSRLAVPLALLAGACFGLAFLLIEQGVEAGQGTLLGVTLGFQVGALPTTVAAALILARPRSWRIRPPRLLLPVVLVGLLDLFADGCLTYATDLGQLGVVSVLASLDPVVSVLLARFVGMERLRALQGVGVVLCVVGVVLVGAG